MSNLEKVSNFEDLNCRFADIPRWKKDFLEAYASQFPLAILAVKSDKNWTPQIAETNPEDSPAIVAMKANQNKSQLDLNTKYQTQSMALILCAEKHIKSDLLDTIQNEGLAMKCIGGNVVGYFKGLEAIIQRESGESTLAECTRLENLLNNMEMLSHENLDTYTAKVIEVRKSAEKFGLGWNAERYLYVYVKGIKRERYREVEQIMPDLKQERFNTILKIKCHLMKLEEDFGASEAKVTKDEPTGIIAMHQQYDSTQQDHTINFTKRIGQTNFSTPTSDQRPPCSRCTQDGEHQKARRHVDAQCWTLHPNLKPIRGPRKKMKTGDGKPSLTL
jgi:hypothetical protein